MGNVVGAAETDITHVVSVTTGDKKGAGTDASVFLTFVDEHDKSSGEIEMDNSLSNDFENAKTDVFKLNLPHLGKISVLHIRRSDSFISDRWFVNKIVVEEKSTEYKSVFPILRWIHADTKLSVSEFDSCLPKDDKFPEQRSRTLKQKRELYKLKAFQPGYPKQVESMPDDESFSFDYQFDIGATAVKAFALTKYKEFTSNRFAKLEDFDDVFTGDFLPKPAGYTNWRSDGEFGNERLSGVNPVMLKLCEEIPPHFDVTPAMIEPFLEGQKFQDVLKNKKLYIVDLTYMAEIECAVGRKVCGPTALFYSQTGGDLVPIAIQLQPKPGPDNPVFLPSDPEYTWLTAKMFFNNADASHHEPVTHLGFTHLLMESVVVVTHRQLSLSHPIFKLLAPHFLYLIAINTVGLPILMDKGGWVDQVMTIGAKGMGNILKYNWARWNLHEVGNFAEDIKRRGVDDTKALPNYHFRDDGLLLWNAIYNYVANVVNSVYDTPEKLLTDTEINAWARELADKDTGAGLNGMPSFFTSTTELIEALTVFIFTGSVSHAAANFGQYDEYAFPPNYPMFLNGAPPKDKTPLAEDDIVEYLPDKDRALRTILMVKILSTRATNSLANFEVQYGFDPIALNALELFKRDLKEISDVVDERNANRTRPYIYLNPREVPNAISI